MNVESKSILAKLMASENISVVHKKIPTAAFDVKNRVLYLPMLNWEAGSSVYDLFCCHEVGHALYTPEDGWHSNISEKGQGYKSFLNVIEDARIEKKIKRRYPGAKRSMHDGYTELNRENFFGMRELLGSGKIDSVDELPLIDRINLHFKLGTLYSIAFTEEEMEWVRKVDRTETFQDVVELCDALYEYSKEKESQFQFDNLFDEEDDEFDDYEESEMSMGSPEDKNSGQTKGKGSGSEEDGEGNSEDEGEASSGGDGNDDEQDKVSSSGIEGGTGNAGSEPKSITDMNYRERETSLVNMDEGQREPLYIQYKEIPYRDYIMDFKKVHADLTSLYTSNENLKNASTIAYNKFRRANEKAVNYMVKEFEMRKSAQEYRRAYTSKKGTLNMSKIHTYRFNDQLFNQVTNFAEGKNHGLVFFLDWSGSMVKNLKDTVDQLMNLVMFCTKVSIPFEVYAFSDGYYDSKNYYRYYDNYGLKNVYKYSENHISVDPRLRLFNFFSSRMNKRELQQAYKNIIMLTTSNSTNYMVDCGTNLESGNNLVPSPCYPGYELSGTPLNCSILLSRGIIKDFIADNKLENVNAIFLTDGASHHFSEYYDVDEDTFKQHHRHNGPVFLEDVETRTRVMLKRTGQSRYSDTLTKPYLQFLRETLKINVLGFYITQGSRAIHYEMQMFTDEPVDSKVIEGFKKQKFAVLKNTFYDEMYVVNSNSLKIDETDYFEGVSSGAKKSEVRKALRKSTSGKLGNRIMLNKFIEKIA